MNLSRIHEKTFDQCAQNHVEGRSCRFEPDNVIARALLVAIRDLPITQKFLLARERLEPSSVIPNERFGGVGL